MDAITYKYGFREGLRTRNGQIVDWPYDEPEPNARQLAIIVAEYEQSKLDAAAKREQIKSWEMQKAASARAKLRGLINGLDEEEAFAIIGKYGARIADMVTEKELMSDMTAQEIIAKKINE